MTAPLLLSKKLNALFIGNCYMYRQERIIPALLKPLGYEFTVRAVYAPGQTFQGHLQNNAGIISDAQREGIECGRIGGWFSNEHCEMLYNMARSNKGCLEKALGEMKYDVAFIQAQASDGENPDQLNSLECAHLLIQMARANNRHVTIVLCCSWAFLRRPENAPLIEWLGKYISLAENCRLAPVGTAFRQAEKELPDLCLFRSQKDPHPNAQSFLLIAYTQICALLGKQASTLNFSVNSYKYREELAVHVELVTDEAPSFESILANNEGRLTPRQQRIFRKIGSLQALTDKAKPGTDALDGFGDYAVDMAQQHIAARKGRLDQALALNVAWDAVIIQGFCGASDPGEEDFQAWGKMLIQTVRNAVGNAPIFLMQHWAPKGAPAVVQHMQHQINAAYRQLADACCIPIIPVGEGFAALRMELLAALYTPNAMGIQLISETIRRHLKLTV